MAPPSRRWSQQVGCQNQMQQKFDLEQRYNALLRFCQVLSADKEFIARELERTTKQLQAEEVEKEALRKENESLKEKVKQLQNKAPLQARKSSDEGKNASPPVIGIDWGTRCSRVTLAANNRIQIVHNELNEPQTISCISITDGLGQDPFAIGVEDPGACVVMLSPKLLLEKRLELREYMIFQWNGAAAAIKIPNRSGELFLLRDLLAMFYKNLLNNTNAHLDDRAITTAVKEAAITVPACFTNYERQLVLDAAKVAGIESPKLVHNSSAIFTNFYKKQETRPKNMAIVAVGAGMTEVCYVERELVGPYSVKAYVSNLDLGAEDVDYALYKICQTSFAKQIPNWSKIENQFSVELIGQCQLIKDQAIEALSDQENEVESYGVELENNGKQYQVEIPGKQVFSLITQFVDKVWALVNSVLIDTRSKHPSFDYPFEVIVLAGAMTRLPLVHEKMMTFTRNVISSYNDDDSLAHGAAAFLAAKYTGPIRAVDQLIDAIPMNLELRCTLPSGFEMNQTLPCLMLYPEINMTIKLDPTRFPPEKAVREIAIYQNGTRILHISPGPYRSLGQMILRADQNGILKCSLGMIDTHGMPGSVHFENCHPPIDDSQLELSKQNLARYQEEIFRRQIQKGLIADVDGLIQKARQNGLPLSQICHWEQQLQQMLKSSTEELAKLKLHINDIVTYSSLN